MEAMAIFSTSLSTDDFRQRMESELARLNVAELVDVVVIAKKALSFAVKAEKQVVKAAAAAAAKMFCNTPGCGVWFRCKAQKEVGFCGPCYTKKH